MLSRLWFDVEPDAEDAAFPESGSLGSLDPATRSRRRCGHQRPPFLIDHGNKHMGHALSLFRVNYIPFAAEHRSGCTLGRRAQRPEGHHARMAQLPSDAPLRELGQASLAVTLAGFPVVSRVPSQAPAL